MAEKCQRNREKSGLTRVCARLLARRGHGERARGSGTLYCYSTLLTVTSADTRVSRQPECALAGKR